MEPERRRAARLPRRAAPCQVLDGPPQATHRLAEGRMGSAPRC